MRVIITFLFCLTGLNNISKVTANNTFKAPSPKLNISAIKYPQLIFTDFKIIRLPNIIIDRNKVLDKYFCKVFDLKVENERTEIRFRFNDIYNETGYDVDELSIQNQVLKFMPEGFEKVFKKLTSITIDNSQLSKITIFSFSRFSFLQELIIINNQIESIDDFSFSYNTQLQKLDLSNNTLKNLPDSIFLHLPSLKTLKLNNNELKELSMNIFDCHNQIQHFDVSNNTELESVQANITKFCLKNATFMDFSNIKCLNDAGLYSQKINRSNNETSEDDDKMFETLESFCKFPFNNTGSNNTLTSKLNVSLTTLPDRPQSIFTVNVYNSFMILKPIIFEELNPLSLMVFIDCELSDDFSKCVAVDLKVKYEKSKILGDFTSVNEVIIKNQTFKFMPEGFEYTFKNLTKLTIDDSQLSKITKSGFSQIPALQELIIINNPIESIDADSFSNNTQLQTLDLSNNTLKQLPNSVFMELRSLKVLKLNNNEFKQLLMNIITCPSQIQHFDFSNNTALESVQPNIVNICLTNATYIDFSNIKCLNDNGLSAYKMDRLSEDHSEASRLHDEMSEILEVNCKSPRLETTMS